MDILPHMEGEKGINNFNDRVCGNSQRNTFWQIIGVFFFLILPKKNNQKTNVFLEEYPSMTTVHQSVCHQPPMLVFVLIDKTLNTFWHRLRVHPPPSNKGHPDIIPTYLRCQDFYPSLGLTRSIRKGRSSIILFHYFWLFVLSSSYE